jgi:hypothetical protein
MASSASPSVSPSISISPSVSPSISASASPSVSPSISVSPSMSPSPADLIYPPTQNGLQKTLGAQLDQGEVSVATFNNTTGIQNKKGLFVVDRIGTDGKEKDASVREYITFDNVSGSTTTGLTRGLGGTTDQDHAVGAIVEFVMDVVQEQAIIDTLIKEHGTNGTHNQSLVAMVAAVQTLTNKTLVSPVINTGVSGSAGVVTTTGTQTLTNKKIIKRVLSATTYTTNTGTSLNCDNYDVFEVTAQAGDLKFNNPTGTPVDGQTLWLSVTGTGARALTYDTQFESSAGATLPTTTVTTARIDIALVWRADTSKWHCVGVA